MTLHPVVPRIGVIAGLPDFSGWTSISLREIKIVSAEMIFVRGAKILGIKARRRGYDKRGNEDNGQK